MRTLLGTLALALSLAVVVRPIAGQDTGIGTVVEVQNDFNDRVGVFVEQGQFDVRIGTVDAISTASLTVPDWVVRQGRPMRLFVVHRGRDLASQTFTARPGERIGLIVPTPPHPVEQMTAELPTQELSKETLTVENERNHEVVVYAEQGHFLVRLGRVAAHTTQTMEFPASVVRSDGMITVVVHPRGEFELDSHPLKLRAGEHLGLKLEPK